MIRRTILLATCFAWLSITTAYTQTTYAVNWVKLKNAEVVNDVLQRTSGAQNKGVGTSQQLLYGQGESNTHEGYIEYTAGNNTELKKLGFVVVDAPEVESGAITYGFSFVKGGKVRAQSPFGNSAKISYSANDVFRIERTADRIDYSINGTVQFTINIDPTEHMRIRGDLKSTGATFANVICSFNTTPFLVIPLIDNVNNKIGLAISGAFPPYTYTWENGAVINNQGSGTNPSGFPMLDCFLDGTYRVTIKDAQGNEVERMFSVGEDIVWTNFYESQVNGDELEKTPGNGWGTATHTNSFDPTSTAWVEYIVEEESGGKKAFGFADASVNIRKTRHLKAGYLISKDLLQIIVDGDVVLTEDYSDQDALNITYNGGTVTWYKNGEEFYTWTYPTNGNVTIAGLVRGNGTLKHVSYDINPEVIFTTTFDDTTGFGTINLDLTSTGVTGPFHYLISGEMVPNLEDTYYFLKDTLGIPVDSVLFFTGNDPNLTHTYSNLKAGSYFVTVFDSQNNRIFGKEIHVQGALTFDAQTGLTVSGNSIVATQDPSFGSLPLYANEHRDLLIAIELSRINGNREQFFGFANESATVTSYQDLEYGFYMQGRNLHTVQNGTLSSTFIRIRQDREITLSIESGVLKMVARGQEVLNVNLPASFIYKVGVGTEPGSTMRLSYSVFSPVPFVFGLPYDLFLGVNQHLECSDNQAQFNFGFSAWGPLQGASAIYTVTNTTTGTTIYDTGPSGTTLSQVFNQGSVGSPLEPGIYSISGTISNGTTTFPFSETICLGYEAEWAQIDPEYVNATSSNSTLVQGWNEQSFLTARSTNVMKFDENGWIEFTPLSNSQNGTSTNIMRFTTANITDLPGFSMLTEDWVAFLRFPFQNFTFGIMHSGENGTFDFFFVPQNERLKLVLTPNPGGTGTVELFNDQTLLASVNRSDVTNIVRCHSIKNTDGFFDVIPSFCIPQQTLGQLGYALVKKKLDGGSTVAVESKLRFEFDGEYDVNTTTFLAYNIYEENRTVLASAANDGTVTGGASALNYNYDDNRYTLDLSGVSLTTDKYYLLEVIDSKGDKKYLKFLFK